MERSCVQLEDLPHEILLIIFQNLYNCHVLYSFLGLNKRLDTLLNDRIFTRNLTLIKSIHSSSNEFPDTILDRVCLEILPRINHKIERLNIESSFMERILLATDYPNLHTLGLYGLVAETEGEVFYEESYLIHRFQNQISSLFIQLKPYEPIPGASGYALGDRMRFIFIEIFNNFKNLRYLNFSSSSDNEQLTFFAPISTNFSSNLLELHVIVKTIYDCLYLLDGQFNQLHTFYVTIRPRGYDGMKLVGNDKKLLNLKCFSLIHENEVNMYESILVPLFQRMTNLEKLSLYFVGVFQPIIDGEDLEKNIINHMPRLNEFTFNICSIIVPHLVRPPISLPSNDDIQHTFRNFQNSQIISSVYYFQSTYFYCHIYSYSYPWIFYYNIRNNFPGGLFKYVREISLIDERPFEHDFLLRIAQSFPSIQKLSIENLASQQNKHLQWPIIRYSHLIEINLGGTHEDYIEEFLNNTKICLLSDVHLRVSYRYLKKVIDNSTRDATRINCSKISRLVVLGHRKNLSKLRHYFPHAKIC